MPEGQGTGHRAPGTGEAVDLVLLRSPEPGARTPRPRWHDLAILLLFGLLVMGAGLGLRDPWPPDEPRYALVAREMVESGQWLIPHRAGEPYPDKPPVFFWMIATAYAATGSLRVAFLLPSLLAGLITLTLVWDLARRLWCRRVAVFAGVALLATAQLVLQARAGQIDGVLAMWTTMALYGLIRHLLLGPAWVWWYVAFAAMGLGVITKGVGFLPLLLLVPWALLRHRRAPGLPRFAFPWWHALGGPAVMVGAACLWVVPMLLAVAASGDPVLAAYRDNLLFKQTGERYVAAWHHVRWAGYYLLGVIPWAWLPLSLGLPWLVPAWWRRVRRGEARTVLLIGWAVLVLLFFSLSPGKRGVYILPAVPAVALGAAPLLPGLFRRRGVQRLALAATSASSALLLALTLWLSFAPASRLAPLLESHDVPRAAALVAPLAVLAVVGALLAVLTRRRAVVGLLALVGAAWLVVGWWLQPLFNSTRSAGPLMASAGELIGPDGELALVQWREQLVLHADRPVTHFGFFRQDTEAESREAAAWAAAAPHRFVLLPRESLAPCFAAARCRDLGRHDGRDWLVASASAIGAACRDQRSDTVATPPP